MIITKKYIKTKDGTIYKVRQPLRDEYIDGYYTFVCGAPAVHDRDIVAQADTAEELKTYKLIVKSKNEEDIVQTGLDRLNAIVISSELKLAFATSFENGDMSIEIQEEWEREV